MNREQAKRLAKQRAADTGEAWLLCKLSGRRYEAVEADKATQRQLGQSVACYHAEKVADA